MHDQVPRYRRKRSGLSGSGSARPNALTGREGDHAEGVLEAWTDYTAFAGAIACNCLGAERIALTAPEGLSSHEAFTSAIGSAAYAREELVAGIDLIKRNRNRFIAEAVRRSSSADNVRSCCARWRNPIPTASPPLNWDWRTGTRGCRRGITTCSTPDPLCRCSGVGSRAAETGGHVGQQARPG
jgi:hypothetical protein